MFGPSVLSNLWLHVRPSCEWQADTHSQAAAGVLCPYRSFVEIDCPRCNRKTEPTSVRTARARFAATKKWLKNLTDFLFTEPRACVCDCKGRIRLIAADLDGNRRALIRILNGVAQDILDCTSKECLVPNDRTLLCPNGRDRAPSCGSFKLHIGDDLSRKVRQVKVILSQQNG